MPGKLVAGYREKINHKLITARNQPKREMTPLARLTRLAILIVSRK